MEQKRKNTAAELTSEIILLLLKEKKLHPRRIAQQIGTNHTAVLRRIKELYKNNVVDFAEEGKNRSYFLKKTTEARISILTAEYYKLFKLFNRYPFLRRIIDKFQQDKRISLAVLFGSYAKWLADEGSDIDIFVETKDLKLKDELSLIDSRLSIKIGSLQSGNELVKEIEKNHILIKGAERYYEKYFFD